MNERDIQPAGHIKYTEIDKLFSQLTTQEVEQFYAAYQLWVKRQKAARLQQEIQKLHIKQAQNAEQIQAQAPSAIVLAAIAQLRSCGVEDIDLLDRMLERGEDWLDNTMQLLSRCEALNVIQGNYTQWCEHALEGAYEWMWSMNNAGLSNYFEVEQPEAQPDENAPVISDSPSTDNAPKVTEDQLLRKLMSEPGGPEGSRQTKPLPPMDEEEKLDATTPFIAADQSELPVDEKMEAAPEAASPEETFSIDIPPALVELLGSKTDSQTTPEATQTIAPADDATEAVEQPETTHDEPAAPVQEPDSPHEEATTASAEQEEQQPEKPEESVIQDLATPDQTDVAEAIPVEEQPFPEPETPLRSNNNEQTSEQVEETEQCAEEANEAEQSNSEAEQYAEEMTTGEALATEAMQTGNEEEQIQSPDGEAELQNPVLEHTPATTIPVEQTSEVQQSGEPLAEEEKADKPHATAEEKPQGLLPRWLARIFGR